MAQRRGAAARGYAVILLVGFLETLELVVTARHDRVQRFLSGFLAAPDLLQFFVFDAADLYIVAQADATALVGHFADHLVHAHVGARVLLVEAGFFGQLEGGRGDRQVTGALVRCGLNFR